MCLIRHLVRAHRTPTLERVEALKHHEELGKRLRDREERRHAHQGVE